MHLDEALGGVLRAGHREGDRRPGRACVHERHGRRRVPPGRRRGVPVADVDRRTHRRPSAAPPRDRRQPDDRPDRPLRATRARLPRASLCRRTPPMCGAWHDTGIRAVAAAVGTHGARPGELPVRRTARPGGRSGRDPAAPCGRDGTGGPRYRRGRGAQSLEGFLETYAGRRGVMTLGPLPPRGPCRCSASARCSGGRCSPNRSAGCVSTPAEPAGRSLPGSC